MRNMKLIKSRSKSAHKVIPACFLVVALILPHPVSASGRKSGQTLFILMKDGRTIEGELLAVKGDRLIIMDSSSLAGIEVQIGEALHLQVRKKSKFFQGLGIGLLSGAAAGALIGLLSGDDEGGWFSMTAGEKALAGALGLGILGAPIGGIAGAIAGIDESIDLTEMTPVQKDLILKKLKSHARMADELPQNLKILPSAPADEKSKAARKETSDVPPKEPSKTMSPPAKSEKAGRFHLSFTPGYISSSSLGQLQGLLKNVGFSDSEPYSYLFGSGMIEFPHVVKNPIFNIKDIKVEYSLSKNFALGIAYSPLGKRGAVGRHLIPDKDYRSSLPGGYVPETYLTGFCGGHAYFLTTSYFPIPDAFLKKFSVKVTAGIGSGRVNMDFYGSEYEYEYEHQSPYSHVDQKSFSKNALAALISAEMIYFFNRHWTLGFNADYKYVPVKISGFPIDCYYWYYDAAPFSGGQMRHEALRVDIPDRTWKFGGFGFGLNFGFHF